MKRCKKCGEHKSAEQFWRHPATRDGLRSWCRACESERERARYRRNNPNPGPRGGRRAPAKTPEELKKYSRELYAKNKHKYREVRRRYVDANLADYAERQARRRAAKHLATPAWSNTFFVQEAYKLCKLREKLTGIAWHVDHIVPLRHKLVCGLHWEQNLRVIPAAENISKGNRHWPGMP